MRAAALNPYDGKLAAGAVGSDPAKLPLRLGSEAAGVVTAVGSDPIGLDGIALAVGDEVYGHRLPGAQASELTVKADRLVRKPATASFAEAAGLLSTGTTAVHALEAVHVAGDDVVLVHGASGGVGRMVAQLALLRGARVIGTASAKRHDELAALGVEPVEYGDGLADRVIALAPGGIDAAVDTVGTDEALNVSLHLLRDSSRFVSIVNFAAALAAGRPGDRRGTGSRPGPRDPRRRRADPGRSAGRRADRGRDRPRVPDHRGRRCVRAPRRRSRGRKDHPGAVTRRC